MSYVPMPTRGNGGDVADADARRRCACDERATGDVRRTTCVRRRRATAGNGLQLLVCWSGAIDTVVGRPSCKRRDIFFLFYGVV